jgi:hypothetical protein
MSEVRNFSEGELWWVQASGSGRVWATASAPASGLLGYVQAGFSYTSAAKYTPIMERGIPDHWKFTERSPIDLSFTMLSTGGVPAAASGSGASVPMIHLELKHKRPEHPGSAFYEQFHGVPIESLVFKEAAEGNTIDCKFRALGMNGPTGSGFLS